MAHSRDLPIKVLERILSFKHKLSCTNSLVHYTLKTNTVLLSNLAQEFSLVVSTGHYYLALPKEVDLCTVESHAS